MSSDAHDNFWTPKPTEQLAREQGITEPQPWDQLTGAGADLWESDEDFEQFLHALEPSTPLPLSR
jgi:hypothetical protein